MNSCSERTAVEQATEEGILIIGNTSEPKGLDPHIVSGVLESNGIRALFEGLVEGHPSKDGVALPGVAEKWYPVDEKRPDEWVFELRKDANGQMAPPNRRRFSFLLQTLAHSGACLGLFLHALLRVMQSPITSPNAPTCFPATTPISPLNGGQALRKLISDQMRRPPKTHSISRDWIF